VRLSGIQVGGRDLAVTTTQAIIDSGTSFLVGAPIPVAGIIEALIDYGVPLSNRTISNRTIYFVKCAEELPAVTFLLDGKPFTLERDDLILEYREPWCLLGFTSLDDLAKMNTFILGDIFMRRYYVEFDWGLARLGIARSRLGFWTYEAGSAMAAADTDLNAAGVSITIIAAAALLLLAAVGGLAMGVRRARFWRDKEELTPYVKLSA